MRLRLLSTFALIYCSIALAQVPVAPPPREADPPVTLPPGERQPAAVFLPADAAGDVADWSLDDARAREMWKTTKGEGQVVAVLDTGGYLKHKDLEGQVVGTIDVTGEAVNDVNSHGTWCATHIVAAENGWGMVGVAPRAKVLIVKVLGGRDGTGSVRGIAEGIRRAVDWRGPGGGRVSVISMSLGGPGTDSFLPPAIAYAKSKGVIVVAAAGNEGPREGTVGYPGGYPDVVCVAAHDAGGLTARFSSRGSAVVVSAPGVNTRAGVPGGAAHPDGLFGTYSGTSMATPLVAGGALGWCAAKGGAWDETRGARFRKDLIAACSHPERRDTSSGYGKIDLGKLVAGATPTPPVEPVPPGKGFSGDVDVIVTFKDGVPVGARLAPPRGGATVDRAVIEKAVKAEMDRALTEAASGTRAIDWGGLVRAIAEAVLRSLIGGRAEGEPPPVTHALPTPTPTPIPPALAAPSIPVFGLPGCANGQCPPRLGMPW